MDHADLEAKEIKDAKEKEERKNKNLTAQLNVSVA